MAKHGWLHFKRVPIHVLFLLAGLGLMGPGGAWAGYASLVMNAESGQILHADGADDINHPASLTKMMTLYMLFQFLADGRVTLATPMKVSARAAAQSPSRLNLPVGATISVENAILALVTKSANDIACVVAETLGDSEAEFATMMTATAHRLGMRNTVFRNASGLPNRAQVTTARDMALLGRALIQNHGRYYPYFSTRLFQYGEMKIPTHNRLLLNYEGADGIKTGYTAASGFNLVTSAKRNDTRLIGVVLGGTTARWRDAHMADLLDAAFARLADKPLMVAKRVPPPGRKALSKNKNLSTASQSPKTASPTKPPVRTVKPPDTAQRGQEQEPASQARMAHLVRKVLGSDQPAAEATASKPKPGGWGIQLGSFRKVDEARASARSVMERLTTAQEKPTVVILTAKVKGATLYRARVMGLTRKDARIACKNLPRQKGRPAPACHVVHPSGDVASTT
ncbi:MAG: D-alanyl-D-alanine carboxypeptidase [Rhodospirillaceae bacterium]|nr:MAG: D-alanyl-D-alanine carboxypeptidase [Rhodospirillaceae bacterium]